MPRPETEFDGAEADVLLELYENPDVPFSSYTLTQRLNSNLQITASEYRTAFAHANSVIEKHYGRGLVRGKRSKGADGVFFESLKLTYKGEQAAILEREQRALPGKVKVLLDAVQVAKETQAARSAEAMKSVRRRMAAGREAAEGDAGRPTDT